MPSLQEVTNQVNPVYEPQISLLEQRLGNVSAGFQPQRSALEQAKINAFRDIDLGSNRRGLFFSGFKPIEQAKFIGGTYTPSLVKLGQEEIDKRFDLTSELAKLTGSRAGDILGRIGSQEAQALDVQLQREQLAQQARIAQARINATLQAARI